MKYMYKFIIISNLLVLNTFCLEQLKNDSKKYEEEFKQKKIAALKEARNWFSKLNNKNQEQLSLIAQYFYYASLSMKLNFLPKNDLTKQKKEETKKILNQINSKLETNSQLIIKELSKKYSNLVSNEKISFKDIINIFNYIKVHYLVIYNHLNNKKITLGYNKGKTLPVAEKLPLPIAIDFLNQGKKK